MAQIQLYFTSEFKRNIRQLAKKYRHIREDIQLLLDQLLISETPGDQVQQAGYTVFKVRVNNSDSNKGKRSGYRVIYYLQTPQAVILVTIYSKTEQSDIPSATIRRLIDEYINQSNDK
ncbi:MAG: type II toxin-antitoxin system RelE/ParE family toxin [Caldilineaceae bacterium]